MGSRFTLQWYAFILRHSLLALSWLPHLLGNGRWKVDPGIFTLGCQIERQHEISVLAIFGISNTWQTIGSWIDGSDLGRNLLETAANYLFHECASLSSHVETFTTNFKTITLANFPPLLSNTVFPFWLYLIVSVHLSVFLLKHLKMNSDVIPHCYILRIHLLKVRLFST